MMPAAGFVARDHTTRVTSTHVVTPGTTSAVVHGARRGAGAKQRFPAGFARQGAPRLLSSHGVPWGHYGQ